MMAEIPDNQDVALPITFVVRGVPLSGQARGRAGWIAKVRGAAALRWGGAFPIGGEVSVVVWYFFRRGGLDVDNMLKPILDALKGVVYQDDGAVSQVIGRKTKLARGLRIRGATAALDEAVSDGSDFVFIKIDGPPDHGAVP